MGELIQKSLELPESISLPAGGATNQVLAKRSSTDNDLKWMTLSSGGIQGVSTYSTNFNVTSFDSSNGFTISLTRWLKDPNKPSPGTAVFYNIKLSLYLTFSSVRFSSDIIIPSTLSGTASMEYFVPTWYKVYGTLANSDSCIITSKPTSYFILSSDSLGCNNTIVPTVYDTSTGKVVDLGTPTGLSISTTVNMFYS